DSVRFHFGGHEWVFSITDGGARSVVGVDNVAPDDLTATALSVAENAASGTVVGTVTGHDANANDTLTYSLVDDAGGRFAIDPFTGEITVGDGTLLDFETATSHTITVRTSDG